MLCPRVLHRSREGIIRQREERKKTSFLCCSIFGSMYSVLLSLTTGQNIRGLRIDLNNTILMINKAAHSVKH